MKNTCQQVCTLEQNSKPNCFRVLQPSWDLGKFDENKSRVAS